MHIELRIIVAATLIHITALSEDDSVILQAESVLHIREQQSLPGKTLET